MVSNRCPMDSSFLFLTVSGGGCGGKFINGEMKEGFRRRSLNLYMGHAYRSHVYRSYMGEISQGVQSMNLVSYFLYF